MLRHGRLVSMLRPPNSASCRRVCQRYFTKTHYDTLGLTKGATSAQIKSSFIRLSKQLHPDVNPSDPHLHAQFVKVNEAYSILICPTKRALYDNFLERQPNTKPPPFPKTTRARQPQHEYIYQKAWQEKNAQYDQDQWIKDLYKMHKAGSKHPRTVDPDVVWLMNIVSAINGFIVLLMIIAVFLR